MKAIIVDMEDMSDSTEVYESRPNPFFIYSIYLFAAIIIVAFVWMEFSDIDVVVKSDGIFKGNAPIYEITSGVTGKVTESYVEHGEYVKEGDALYVLDIEALSNTITNYQNELQEVTDRLDILGAYQCSLYEKENSLDAFLNNPYYTEFCNRRELLLANIELEKQNVDSQLLLFQGNVDSIAQVISSYNEKINELNVVNQCILTRKNCFESKQVYYYSIVNSYLSSYNYTAKQYDNQILECQNQIDEYNKKIEDASNDTLSSNTVVDVEELKKQRNIINITMETVKDEKNLALLNLEHQQISSIEQQIESLNNTILSMDTNLTSAELQLESAKSVNSETKENIAILTEKGNVDAEILNYQEKQEECQNYLKSYDIQNNNCTIRANTSGYFYEGQELKKGAYVQEGSSIGKIYPEQQSNYYAFIFVGNSDIAKIQVGQKVIFEISAYPSNEYGYFTGEVSNIAKDITIDESTGYAYYLVKAECDVMAINNKEGKEASLMNGMACEAKIIIDRERILTYLLHKIDLLE